MIKDNVFSEIIKLANIEDDTKIKLQITVNHKTDNYKYCKRPDNSIDFIVSDTVSYGLSCNSMIDVIGVFLCDYARGILTNFKILEGKNMEIKPTEVAPPPRRKRKLTKDDVWGEYDIKQNKMVSKGLVIAGYNEKCPIWHDVIPYKSATIICTEEQEADVIYWIVYVQGGKPSKRKELPDGKIALRSDYHCW